MIAIFLIKFSPDIFFSRLIFSFTQAFVVAVLSLFFGILLAFICDKLRADRVQKFFDTLMLTTVFLPSVVVAIGFILVWGENGYANKLFGSLGFEIKLIYNFWAIIAAHLYYNIPLVFLAIRLRLSSFSEGIEQAAKVCAASQLQILRYIILPRILPTVVSAGLLVFLFSMMSFNIPLILGGVRWQTIEVYIYHMLMQKYNLVGAVQIAFLQMLVVFSIIIMFARFIKRTPEVSLFRDSPNRKSIFILIVYFLQFLFGLYIILPLFAVLLRGFDVNNFAKLFRLGWGWALLRSMILALSVIMITIFMSLFFVLNNFKKIGKLIFLLIIISPVALSAFLFLFFSKSWISINIAYIILLLPVSYFFLLSRYNNRPDMFTKSLVILGADKEQVLVEQVKYLRPALIRVVALGFSYVLGDLAVSSLLVPPSSPTAMSLSYNLLGIYRYNLSVSGMSLILMTIIFCVFIIYSFDRKIYV